MNIFVSNLFSDPLLFFTVIIAVGFSVCLHEFAHAYAALKCGDPTAANAGHLTLNPLKQMGWISIIMLLLLGFCWGAVPVNPMNLTRKKRIFVALSGVLCNLILFLLGALAATAAYKTGANAAGAALLIFTQLNLVLLFINILPVPGFDGGTVLAEILPMHKLYSSELGKGFMLGMVLIFFYCVDYIFMASSYITTALINFLWRLC